jgi:methionyl-tRNA formyltransferase
MRIVFMGTPEFAVPSLRKLHADHQIAAVVTATDKPAGRGKKMRPSQVKVAAQGLELPILQPDKLKSPDFLDRLIALNADLFVVVAFRMLPAEVWAMPPKGTINLHGSLLPMYRGAAPINRAIMNGETETGLTTFFINENIDTGAIIDSVTCPIGPNETAGDLHDRMMHLGADLLADTVAKIEKGTAVSRPQPEVENLKTAPKLFPADCKIDWSRDVRSIHDQIRGLSPYPTAFTEVEGAEFDRMKIFHSQITPFASDGEPGEVTIADGDLLVATGSTKLKVMSLQIPGKKRMATQAFLNGFRAGSDFRFA